MNARIIVGVSGGLDSTLAALRLLHSGWNVIAAHLDMLDTENAEDAGPDHISSRRSDLPGRRRFCRPDADHDVCALMGTLI